MQNIDFSDGKIEQFSNIRSASKFVNYNNLGN